MLSNTCKYAIRAVIYLALNAEGEKKIGIKKISEDLTIPTPFLGKILQILAKNKILSSTKGPHGGFGIGRNPEKIKLMDIVTIIDGMDHFEMCGIGLHTCSEQGVHCAIHSKYSPLRDQIKTLFENQTVSGLVDDIREGKQKINL